MNIIWVDVYNVYVFETVNYLLTIIFILCQSNQFTSLSASPFKWVCLSVRPSKGPFLDPQQTHFT